MRQGFFESAGEMGLRRFWGDAEDGFAKAEDAVGCGFEGLRDGIVRMAGDDDLDWVMREERGGEAVGGGEEAVLRGDAGESFERFLGEDAVAFVAGEGVHSNQGDGGDGIGAGRGGILKGLAADVEATHGRGARWITDTSELSTDDVHLPLVGAHAGE